MRLNVLDWVDPASDDFIDDALLVADALVMTSARGDPFWTDEARALVMGFILYASAAVAYVKTDPKEAERRNLGRVRELLNLDGEAFTAFIDKMKESPNEYVQAAAGRISNKADKERASVISTAQQNTHFLEGPRIRESLSASDFDFRELENGKTDIYLILPADNQRRKTMSTTQENNKNPKPDFIAKTRDGHGKNASFDQVGVAWSREDGSIYFKPYGKQVIEAPIYLFKVDRKNEGTAEA